MTVYNGALLYNYPSGKGSISPSWMGITMDIGEGFNPSINVPSGVLIPNRPMPLRGHVFDGLGVETPSPATNFYNRILVEPSSIDFGSIVSDQSRVIKISNLYLSSKTLSSIDKEGFNTWLSLSGPTVPLVVKPLQEKEFTLTATLNGGPSVLASLTFNFAGLSGFVIPITGDRVVLYAAVFNADVKETLIFLTDVLVSRNGTEQRVMVRKSPRQQFSISSYHDRNERGRIENLLYNWRHRVWAIPLWIEARKATSSVSLGDTVINVDTRYGDFRVDGLAVVWESPRKFDVFTISDMTESSITLSRGINANFSSPYVMPVRSARMVSDPVRKTTGSRAIVDAVFEVTDNTQLSTSASDISFLGEDTYLDEQLSPNTSGAEDKFQRDVRVLDYQSGVVDISSPWLYTHIVREIDFLLEGKSAIWAFRKWIHRRSGRLRPFYAPTKENNLRLTQTGTIFDTLYVLKDDYTVHGKDRNHLAIRLTDGTYLFRTVTGISDGADFTSVVLDNPLNVDASLVDEISYMGLKRLNSDRIEISWYPNDVAISRVPFIEVQP